MKTEILNWLRNIEKIDGFPPEEVIAFNLGIFESEQGYLMYLVGGFEYSEEDDDWACIEPPKEPHRYLKFPKNLQNENWEIMLEYSRNILSELESEGELNSTLLKKAKVITTGFDDGELIRIR